MVLCILVDKQGCRLAAGGTVGVELVQHSWELTPSKTFWRQTVRAHYVFALLHGEGMLGGRRGLKTWP